MDKRTTLRRRVTQQSNPSKFHPLLLSLTRATSSFGSEIRSSVLQETNCESWSDIRKLKLELVINLRSSQILS